MPAAEIGNAAPRRRWRWMLAALLAAGAAWLWMRGRADVDPKLYGVWKLEYVQTNGMPPRRERELWVFRSSSFRVVDETEARNIAFDAAPAPADSPARLVFPDWLPSRAIYTVDGDVLQVCRGFQQLPWPTAFATEFGDMRQVLRFHRLPARPDLQDGVLVALLHLEYGPEPDYGPYHKPDPVGREFMQQKLLVHAKDGSRWTRKDDLLEIASQVEAQIDNGGLYQFLCGGQDDLLENSIAGLRELGAPRTAALLEEVHAVFPSGRAPRDADERRRVVENFTREQHWKLQELDRRFYCRKEDFGLLLIEYWKAHPEP